ncbi:MAG: HNH endonuclease [Planctomycetes bacterium]|nr:HNH endonuclease [Planctomycetota bacterium]
MRLIWERAQRCCEYCQVLQAYDRLPFEIDHVIAKKHRGKTQANNLRLACEEGEMGMNFVALMEYAGPDERILRVLDSIAGDSPGELKVVARIMKEQGFAVHPDGAAGWECWKSEEPKLDQRPKLPNLEVALHTPEDFFLIVGRDAIAVWHLLRWRSFLTKPALQHALLDACSCLARLFKATACIITSDFSPIFLAFREGKSFGASLAAAGPDDGERPRLADLYLEFPEDYVMRANPRNQSRREYKDWPKDRAPPAGWERSKTWDSKGYWRMPLP